MMRFLNVQSLRAAMPDQTKCIFQTTVSSLSEPINIVNKSYNRQQQQQQQQYTDSGYVPISDIILQHQQASARSQGSPRIFRRYSKPQGDSCDCDDLDLDHQQESSVDGEQVDLLKQFQSSVQDSRFTRRRSSPDINFPSVLTADLKQPTSVNISYNNVITDSSPASIAATTATVPIVDYPIRPSEFPRQSHILGKMVGTKVNTQPTQPQVDNARLPPSSSSTSSPSLLPSKSCPKFQTFDDDLLIDIYSAQSCSKQPDALLPSQPKSAVISSSDCNKYGTNSDSVDSSAASGFGILSKTRQFGTWLGLSVDSKDQVEISKKDLNVFAPTTF